MMNTVLAIFLLLIAQTMSAWQICYTGRDTMLQSPTFLDFFSYITEHGYEHQICLRCLGYFKTEETFARHKVLCTRDDFMSVLHVLPTSGSKQAQLKFYNYMFCTMATFVIYADFKSMFEPFGFQTIHTTCSHHHKVFAAAAILCFTLGRCNQLTMTKVGENALAELLDVLIKWEMAIVKELRINRLMQRISA